SALSLVLSLSEASAPSAFSPLSLHDALPISFGGGGGGSGNSGFDGVNQARAAGGGGGGGSSVAPLGGSVAPLRPAAVPGSCSRRSEEHTSELQSLDQLVFRLLLVNKKNTGPS